jgi:hypothetical protein
MNGHKFVNLPLLRPLASERFGQSFLIGARGVLHHREIIDPVLPSRDVAQKMIEIIELEHEHRSVAR